MSDRNRIEDLRGGVQTTGRAADQKLYGNIKPEYGGVFIAQIVSINTDGTAIISPFGISPNGEKTINAKIPKIIGGNNEAAGLHSTPSVGSTCVCAFEHAQGGQNTAIILTYLNPGKAGTAGLNPGDFVFKSDRGLTFSIDNSKNMIELTDAFKFGMTFIDSNVSLYSKTFRIDNYKTGATEINFNNKAASIIYESAKHSINLSTKNLLFQIAEDFKTSTTGNREEVVIGEFNLKGGNLTNDAVHQLTLIAGEKVLMSTTGDIDNVSENHLTTVSSNIVRGSAKGSIVDYAQVGSITLATGTVTTTGTSASTGSVPVAAAKIQLSNIGEITLDNKLSSTKHLPGGIIKTDAKMYSLSSDGVANFSTKGIMSFDAKASMMLESVGLMSLKTKAIMTLEATGATSIKSSAAISLDAGGIITVKAIGVSFTNGLPVSGLKTITLFGPQPLLPI